MILLDSAIILRRHSSDAGCASFCRSQSRCCCTQHPGISSASWVDGATPKSTWTDEVWSFYTEFKNFSFLYKEGGNPWLSCSYHVWSIPIELRGSMVIFASLLALSRCTLSTRLWCQLFITGYYLYIADGWYCAMFTAGMLLSHLDLLAKTEPAAPFPCTAQAVQDVSFTMPPAGL